MPIKIAVCDDAEEDIVLLSSLLLTYDPSFHIVTYRRGDALLDDLLEGNCSVDLLFLDIYMPGLNGIKTAEKIHNRYPELKIVFISSSKDHYPQAYEVFAFNYILKPIGKERLYVVLDRAIAEMGKEQDLKVRIQYKSTVHSVNCREIQYIESRDKLLIFHLVDGTTLQCYGKLDIIIQELPEQLFVRCHQSFLVNIRHVTEMGENYFRAGPVVIAISKKHLKHAKDQYYAYLFSRMGGRLGT